jgi:hypothetical protein
MCGQKKQERKKMERALPKGNIGFTDRKKGQQKVVHG